MRIVALVNPSAGSVPADGIDRLRSKLVQLGHPDADIHALAPEDCETQLRDISKGAPDVIIVWGGDGTLKLALNTVGQTTPNLLLLPGGTMNILPRAIHNSVEWEKILTDVLHHPRHALIPGGRVGDHTFFCALLAGAPAHFAEAREKLRKGEVMGALADAAAAIDTLQSIHLTARFRDAQFGVDYLPTTSILGALVGPLAKNGRMEVAALEAPSTIGALNLVWTNFIQDWRTADGVKVAAAETLTIEGDGDAPIPAIADGEHIDAGPKLRIEFIEKAAQCLKAA